MAHRTRTRGLVHPAERPLHVARTRAHTVSIGLVVGVSIAGLVFGLCFLYLWQATGIQELTAQREAARAHLVEIEELNRELEFQIAQAFSLERISRIARSQLGMIEPTVIRYVPLSTDDHD
jgi:cell division protein FtsB